MKKAEFIKAFKNAVGRDIAISLISKGWALAAVSPESICIQRNRAGMKLILPLAERLKPELIEIIADRIERNEWKPQGKRGGLNGFCYPVKIKCSSSGGFYATSKAFPEMFAQTDSDDILIMARKALQTALLLRSTDKEPLPFGKKFEAQEADTLFHLMPQHILKQIEEA